MKETSRRDPAGSNPDRPRWTTSRKRVLRGLGVTPAAKRRQRACGLRDGASKGVFDRSRRRRNSGRHHRCGTSRAASPNGPIERGGPVGVGERGTHARVPQEPGKSRRLHPSGWYPQAKETKRGEMGGEMAEHPVVPLKAGNPPQGTRWREGDARTWNHSNERRRDAKLGKRLNKTRADSEAGEERT
jgi:hypothetical protein